MIKNVVFDCGQVLIHFDPKYMVERYVTDPADSALLQEVVFDRLYWSKLDLGTITDEEVVAAACARVPERLHGAVSDIYYHWIYNIPEREGMRELTRRLKADGVKLCLLSDISKYFIAHRDEITILDVFDTCVFSADYGLVKPHREAFENLCRVCELDPSETVFVDDNPINVKGAEDFGIRAYLFDGDAVRLTAYLYDLLAE